MPNGLGLVSVIIPVCNQGDHARRTVESVREGIGDLPHEIILVDDQSTDGCCHGMPRDILVLRTQWRAGVSSARRLGFSHSRGDVIIWSDPHCSYPPGSLRQLAEAASRQEAILQPKTVSRPGTRERFGGRLVNSERGLRVAPALREPAKYPALMGTIYALRRTVYERMGGWPSLPGVWGYSEQALTLMSWFLDIPVVVDHRFTCVHLEYQKNRRFPFSVSQTDWAGNAHYVHAAFFPESYRDYWRPILEIHFGRDAEHTASLRSGEFHRLREWVQCKAVRTEQEFFRDVLDWAPPTGSTLETGIRAPVPGNGDSRAHRLCIDAALEWLVRCLPREELLGRRALYLSSHNAHGAEVLGRLGTGVGKGTELVLITGLDVALEHHSQRKDETRQLPVPDSSWDVVTCLHAMEHWPDPAEAVREMSRVLCPGGWLYLVVLRETSARESPGHAGAFVNREELRRLVLSDGAFEASTLRESVDRLAKGKRLLRMLIQKKGHRLGQD